MTREMKQAKDQLSPKRRIAVISGASSGAGSEFARQIARDCPDIDELWLLARRMDRMAKLGATLSKPCRLFSADITKEAELVTYFLALENENISVSILVNNAGYGKSGKFMDIDEADNLGVIELNNSALVRLCQRSIPYMERGSRIINVASVAAFLPQPGFAIYAASKAFVLSFSRALHQELRPAGITVLAACPNPMATEFSNRSQAEKPSNGKRSIKDFGIEPVDRMVRLALQRSKRGKDTSLSCWQARALLLMSRVFPHRLILFVMSRMGLGS